jgi:hypothetical protein
VPHKKKWPRWGATSTKMVIVNEVSNKSDKSIGAILRVAFEQVPTVRVANM